MKENCTYYYFIDGVSSHSQNTGSAFDVANYPNAVAGGVFFVALEDNYMHIF